MGKIIVFGNEKGGSGKSTTAIHVAISLCYLNKNVGVIDLDIRQKSMSRFLENRDAFCKKQSLNLPRPKFYRIDQRVIEKHKLKEVSIGDFILTGGELGAMVLLDTVVRLLPGTLGNSKSALTESFTDGLLEAPQFTKPIDWNGLRVPEILRTGDHQKILDWRTKTSEQVTKKNRPDLFIKYVEKKKKMIKRK